MKKDITLIDRIYPFLSKFLGYGALISFTCLVIVWFICAIFFPDLTMNSINPIYLGGKFIAKNIEDTVFYGIILCGLFIIVSPFINAYFKANDTYKDLLKLQKKVKK